MAGSLGTEKEKRKVNPMSNDKEITDKSDLDLRALMNIKLPYSRYSIKLKIMMLFTVIFIGFMITFTILSLFKSVDTLIFFLLITLLFGQVYLVLNRYHEEKLEFMLEILDEALKRLDNEQKIK